MTDRDAFVSAFDRLEKTKRREPGWVGPLRKAGLSRFAEKGLPTRKQEDWRFTDVSALTELAFHLSETPAEQAVESVALDRLPFGDLECYRLVFIDGHFHAGLSRLPEEEGLSIQNLTEAIHHNERAVQKHLGHYARDEFNPFLALNEAYFQDGVFIHLAPHVALSMPVQTIFLSTAKKSGRSAQPRNLILADRGSRITLLESYFSLGAEPHFTNTVNELLVGDNARVEHVKFQDENSSAYHLGSLHAHLGHQSFYGHHSIALGARLSRNNIRMTLNGEGLNCLLNGLYFTNAARLADHHMIVDHAKPHGESHEYFNGILDDQSKGVFHGRILVREGAQKTDAKQTNKNLLLSDAATIDTKPQLEIYADDVKCTHGATVGQLDADAIFYLRSRGMDAADARRMLIHAFAGEIIDRIEMDSLRKLLDGIVRDRLEMRAHID